MFSQYTWGDFWKVVGTVTVLYYLYVGVVYFRRDIINFYTRRKAPKDPMPSADSLESDADEDMSDFLVIRNYGTSAKMEVPAERVEDVQVLEKPARKKARSKSVRTPAVKKNDLPQPEIQRGQRDLELPAVPVVYAQEGDTLQLLSGIVIPQQEQLLDDVIESASGINKRSDGALVAKPEATEKTRRLARILNDQKDMPDELSDLSFKRK